MSNALTLAIPTGRIFEATAELLSQAGWTVPTGEAKSRKLRLSNPRRQSLRRVRPGHPTSLEMSLTEWPPFAPCGGGSL